MVSCIKIWCVFVFFFFDNRRDFFFFFFGADLQGLWIKNFLMSHMPPTHKQPSQGIHWLIASSWALSSRKIILYLSMYLANFMYAPGNRA